MLTIFIGINDATKEHCMPKGAETFGGRFDGSAEESILESMVSRFNYLLSIIQQNCPRTIVNLIPLPAFDYVYYGRVLDSCRLNNHLIDRGACHESTKGQLAQFVKKWNENLETIASDWNTRGHDDFAVIAHSNMFTSLNWGSKKSWKYLSASDCFHFSKRMHRAMAVNLWNSLVTASPENKRFEGDIHCALPNTKLRI